MRRLIRYRRSFSTSFLQTKENVNPAVELRSRNIRLKTCALVSVVFLIVFLAQDVSCFGGCLFFEAFRRERSLFSASDFRVSGVRWGTGCSAASVLCFLVFKGPFCFFYVVVAQICTILWPLYILPERVAENVQTPVFCSSPEFCTKKKKS